MDGDEEVFERLSDDTIAALDLVPVPVTILDVGGIIRWQNQAATVLRGIRVGLPYISFVAASDRDDVRRALCGLAESRGAVELEVRELDSGGGYVPVCDRLSVLPRASGGNIVVVLSMADVDDPQRPDAGKRWAPTLTPRQLDVLRLLAAGMTTRQISDTLGLSSATVRNHVARLLAELGAHSRLQAVVAARRAGLIE